MSRPNIDETDVKIINILQEDPRTTYLQLAKDCQVSIDSVRRRYERLRKDGIVVSEIISLLPQALGVDCISWLGITTQPGKESEVLESLKAKPEIQANFVEIGKYNIRSILGVKHLNDLAGVVDSIKKIQYINDVDVMIWSDIQSMAYPRNLVIEPFSGSKNGDKSTINQNMLEIKTSSTSSVKFNGVEKANLPLSLTCPDMDKIDETILNVLLHNARIPFSTIAKQLGISTKTAICRYKKLKKNWVAYSTLAINLRKIGYDGYVSYNIKVGPKSWVNEVFDRIVKIPNVIAALKLVGPYNINIVAPFSNPDQLMKLHISISEIPGIARIDQQIGDSMHVWPAR